MNAPHPRPGSIRAPLHAAVVLLILIGTALAGPVQAEEDVAESAVEACQSRRVVVASATAVIAERVVCLTSDDVDALADLHDQQTWLANVTAPDACTVLSWHHTNTTWTAAACYTDSAYGDADAGSACETLSLSEPARLDLCPQSANADETPRTKRSMTSIRGLFNSNLEGDCSGGEDSFAEVKSSSKAKAEEFFSDPCRNVDDLEQLIQDLEQCIRSDTCIGLDVPAPVQEIVEACLAGTGVGMVCGIPFPDPCPGGADFESPCGVQNPCPEPPDTAEGDVLIEVCGIPFPDPCPGGADFESPCGVQNPCPEPPDTAEGDVLIEVCGIPFPDPCPGGADFESPCGVQNPCPDPADTPGGSTLVEVCGIPVPNLCRVPADMPGGSTLVEVCGIPVPNPCPTPISSGPGSLIVVCGVPVPDPCPGGADFKSPCGVQNPCPEPADTPGGNTLVEVCGFPVPNPCPSPIGSAPGALVVLCGIPIPNPCTEGVDTTQACGQPLPDPDPFVELVLALVEFALDTTLGCANGALDETGDVPAGSEDTLGCGAVVRLALDTADQVVALAWEGVNLATAVANDCLSAFDSDAEPSDHPTTRQIGCGQLLRDLLEENPCKDVLDPQQLSSHDPVVCGETIPVSTVEDLVDVVADCAGAQAPGDGDSSNVDDGGLQETCDEARSPKTVTFVVPCNERDADGDGVPVVDVCEQAVTVDPSGEQEPDVGEPTPLGEGSAGDPDDSDDTTPIPFIDISTDVEPACGGAYELGATVILGGQEILSPATGTLPCPLPFTTPTYPHTATMKGEGPPDNDRDGVPGFIVFQQRQTTIHPDGSTSHEAQDSLKIPVDPDDDDEKVPLARFSVRVDPVEPDEDGDGIGDEYQEEWEQRLDQTLDWLQDFDGDGLENVDEFRWDLIPICVPLEFENCMDWEQDRRTSSGGDNWLDGEEVPYWNDPSNDAHIASLSEDGVVILEPDRHHDVDGDGLPDTRDPDADDDNLLDGDEVKTYRTYPEFQDSDCAPEATACTLSHETSGFYDEDRLGSPGTGDGIHDDAEIEAWNDLAGATWDGDADGDGIPNLMDGDSDDDELDDGPEFLEGQGQVLPNNEDSDNDGVLDGLEALWNVDSDGDGWLNAADPDSDNDGMPDGWEVRYGFDPLDPTDALRDADADGLNNLGEYSYGLPASWNVRVDGVYWGGTLPLDPDTDDDELLDGPEVLEESTDPFDWDTDSDGLPDAWEAEYKTMGSQVVVDPLTADALNDADEDSTDADWCSDARGRDYHNLREYEYGMPSNWDSRPVSAGGDGVYWAGTEPNNPNTDGDLLPDGYEVCTGSTDPKAADVTENGDEDDDGLLTVEEVDVLTDFLDWDTDGDGLCDGGGRALNCTLVEGAGGDGEVRGWMIIVDGQTRLVTSDPIVADTDGDLLGDLQERTLGTDPRDVDTDSDGLQDGDEDLNRNGARDGGELDALDADSDDDGLQDGAERNVYFTDGLDIDTDFDGLTDGDEVHIHGTDPRDYDSDDDLRSDGEEVGEVASGGDVSVLTNLLSSDTDGDGLLDGEELYFYGLDPNDDDEDCDGFIDGTDPSPYASNVPPGVVRSAADRAACNPAGTPSTSWSSTVGLVDFNSNDDDIIVLAADPPSENSIAYREILVELSGTVRTVDGMKASSTTMRAELRPLGQPAADGSATYTHGVRMTLPLGMVHATSASYSLTFVDENTNAATYDGSDSSISIWEKVYRDENDPANNEEAPNRPGCENMWWEDAATGEAGSSSQSFGGFPDLTAGLPSPGSLDGHSIQRIVQQGAPAWTGQVVDDVLVFAPFSSSFGPYVVFENASVPLSDDELQLYQQMGWGGTSFSLPQVGYAVTSVWDAGVDLATDAGSAVGRAATATGEALVEAKDATVGFYHDFRQECNHWLTWTANGILDIAFVGDIESITYGIQEDDRGEVAMGVFGIATVVIPGGKAAGGALKTGLRAGDNVADAYDASKAGTRILEPMAKLGTDAANAGGDALKEAKILKQTRLLDFAKDDPTHARGLIVLAGVEDTAAIGRDVVDNRLLIEFAGGQAARMTDEAAETTIRGLVEGPVALEKVGQATVKINRISPGDGDSLVDAVVRFGRHADEGADNGIVGMVGKATGDTKDYHAAGHGWQVIVADEVAHKAGRAVVKTADGPVDFVVDASETTFKKSYNVEVNGKEVRRFVDNHYTSVPDADGNFKVLAQEVKHITGGRAANYKGGEVGYGEFVEQEVLKDVAMRKLVRDTYLETGKGPSEMLLQWDIKGRASPDLRDALAKNGIDLVERGF